MLRDYQITLLNGILQELNSGVRAILAVLPTGGGKTVVMSELARHLGWPSCEIAHRQELVGQISLALARAGIRHKIVAPKNIVTWLVGEHIRETGSSWYDPLSIHAVAGIDTLVRHGERLKAWLSTVRLVQMDEGHHVLPENKWGRGVLMFPNVKLIVGWTATPWRTDKKRLDGVYQRIVAGPGLRDLIDRQYLTDYKIYGVPEAIDVSRVALGSDGDFNPHQLRAEAHKSQIVGDIVTHYMRIAPGMTGLTFVVDVASAHEVVAAYRAAGVSASAISAETPAPERAGLMRQFRTGAIQQLVSVDIFGEGTDVPCCGVISMGRPTMSEGLYRQQFGRVLRLAQGKRWGIVIDHVGNVTRHGLPDAHRVYTLDAPPKRKKNTKGPSDVKACLMCYEIFEIWRKACPNCGHVPVPGPRDKPEQVDGDLTEFSEDLLKRLRGDAVKAVTVYDKPSDARGYAIWSARNDQARAQHILRASIALWAGYQRDVKGLADADSYRLFYHTFGVDVSTAQGLSAREAMELNAKCLSKLPHGPGV